MTGLLACFTAMSLAAAVPAAALTFHVDTAPSGLRLVMVTGEFLMSDDLGAFERLVRTSGVRAVGFDSPGGEVYRAMELGWLIRRLDLGTMALRRLDCASACALAFLGGAVRYAEPGSIGVHRSSFNPPYAPTVEEAVAAVQQGTADVMSYIAEMGADPGLLQLAFSYDNSDMRYLSASEMDEFGVTTMPAGEDASNASDPSTAPKPMMVTRCEQPR